MFVWLCETVLSYLLKDITDEELIERIKNIKGDTTNLIEIIGDIIELQDESIKKLLIKKMFNNIENELENISEYKPQ